MKNSSIAPRKKGSSWIKNRLGTNEPETTKTENITTTDIKQCFFKALEEKNLELIKHYIEKENFDVNTEYRFNTTLSIAINLEESKEIVYYLISKKANTTAAMAAAATEGNLEGIKLLLNAKANIDGTDNESPIMLASQHGHAAIVKYLLEQGAKHNVQGWCGTVHNDVDSQVEKLSILWEKVNNTNLDSPELSKHFQNILNGISQTSISSNYNQYKNLSLEQIKEQLPKFLNQLYKDIQKFTEIKNLLEDYSSKEKGAVNTNTKVDDEGYVSDFNIEAEKEKPKTGSRLDQTPSKSGIFNTFSLEELNELDENPTSLSGNTKDIFDSEF